MKATEKVTKLQEALRDIERWLLECGAGDVVTKMGPLSGDCATWVLERVQGALNETGAP